MKSLDVSTWLNHTFHPIHPEAPSSSRFRIPTWQSLLDWVAERIHNPAEPHVWQSHDRTGTVIWHAYDPLTNRAFACPSEDEMRQWLEERYYYRQAEFTMPNGH